jgi:SHS2 domain-containing protein
LKGYTFLEHVSDAFIEAYGTNMSEAFSNAALGLIDTMIDITMVSIKQEVKFQVKGFDLESLLYNWLETVLIKVSRDGIVFSSFKIRVNNITGFELSGYGFGEMMDLKKHRPKTEVKAITYHLMKISEKQGKTTVRFLLDL